MKNKKIKMLFIVMLLSVSSLIAQKTQNKITINTTFEIILNQTFDTLENTYDIDISNIEFQSENHLIKFCESFSLDFYKMNGDYLGKKIRINFDLNKLQNRNLSIKDINNQFKNISNRMEYMFNLLKQ